MGIFEKNDGSIEPTIAEYYKGKSIFITGGTGFLGKLLIEKLLYSCPDLKQIFVFVRDKKGMPPEKRIAALYKSSCFDRLRNERSGLFQSKVTVIPGNMIENNLGLNETNRALVIENTNIIIHSAATVRFDESLKESFDINVLGALRLVELAQDVHNLESYIHISTAFCNLDYEEQIQEKIYPPAADWRKIRDMVDNVDPEAQRILTPKLLGKFPNSYVFTKNMAEHVVNEYRGKLPVAIVRPSIVTGCLKEPSPGWIDNFNGPAGLFTAAAQGILRAAVADGDAKSDYVPADVVVKGTLVAAWVRGIKKEFTVKVAALKDQSFLSLLYGETRDAEALAHTKVKYGTLKKIWSFSAANFTVNSLQGTHIHTPKLEKTDDIEVYNACAGEELSMSLAEIHTLGKQATPLVAAEHTLRPTHMMYFKNKLIFFLYISISHVLPAIAVDLVFRGLGKKPKLLKVQRRSLIANIALEFFMVRPWHFVNDNFMSLRSMLKPQDREQFFFSSKGVHSLENMVAMGLRVRKDLLHQDEKTVPKWKKIYEWEVLIDAIVTYIFYVCVFWWIADRFLKVWDL